MFIASPAVLMAADGGTGYESASVTKLDRGDEGSGSGGDGSARARYAVSVSVSPSLARDVGKQVTANVRRNAHFPGFRKGTIPPFAQSTVMEFTVQECIETTLKEVADAHGFALPDDGEAADIRTDVDALRKTLKFGEGFDYEAHVTLERRGGTVSQQDDAADTRGEAGEQ